MSKTNEMLLSLDGATFSAMKKYFDDVLNRTIGNMQMKGASDATITLKMDVSITKGITNINGTNMDYNKPAFKHQVSSVLQIKDKATGQLAGEMVLEWDDDAEKFVLRRVDDGQTSLFDDDYEDCDDGAIDVNGLPEPAPDEGDDSTQTARDDSAFDVMMGFTNRNLTIVESNDVYTVRTEDTNEVVLSSGCEDGSPFKINAEIAQKHVGDKLLCYMFSEDSKHVSGIAIDCTSCDETIFIMKAPKDASYEIPSDTDISDDEDSDATEGVASGDCQFTEFPEDDDYNYDSPEEDVEE